MTKTPLHWKPDLRVPTGKGATEQHFTASAHGDDLEIDTPPLGDADWKINGKLAAHVEGKPSGSDAFGEIEALAEQIEDQMT